MALILPNTPVEQVSFINPRETMPPATNHPSITAQLALPEMRVTPAAKPPYAGKYSFY
ncbi:hypothetical protein [Iodobacter ciconiae]|uniref:hypothetical protein n=1 Tax=Iodobacter ciconiae TaxID=2496266 RepID=UPI0013DF97C1|nr:hypothetical protein [Iodobacter ciconiae]